MLSAIQPSGDLGIGHYLGAIRHWVRDQNHLDARFMVADLHALTKPLKSGTIAEKSYDLVAWFLAFGLKKDAIFVQSHVTMHNQLAWVLMCDVGMGELARMTQYKDKKDTHQQAGLFVYPALMAADILLYDADIVPVGADQKQHVELAITLASRLNHKYGQVVTVPKAVIAEQGARLMGLQNPEKKMSKSDDNANNYIALADDPKLIVKKLKRAVTDSIGVVSMDENRPGITNLIHIFSGFSGQSPDDIVAQYQGKGYGQFKQDCADCIVSVLGPIQEDYKRFREDITYLNQVMSKGAQSAQDIARTTLERVYRALGLPML